MNPLLFIPKVRNIKPVIDSWKQLNYDKLIVENCREVEAYQFAKRYCLDNKYSHLVICPDDLVITKNSFERLKNDMESYNITNIAGVANFVENENELLCCKLSQDRYVKSYEIPSGIYNSRFTGFVCQWIKSEILDTLSFEGACSGGLGCLDTRFIQDMGDNAVWVDTEALFIHLSKQQRNDIRRWKLGHDIREKKSFLIKSTNTSI